MPVWRPTRDAADPPSPPRLTVAQATGPQMELSAPSSSQAAWGQLAGTSHGQGTVCVQGLHLFRVLQDASPVVPVRAPGSS